VLLRVFELFPIAYGTGVARITFATKTPRHQGSRSFFYICASVAKKIIILNDTHTQFPLLLLRHKSLL